MSVNVDDVKAGTYELVAVRWDQRTSEPGKPFTFKRYRRGDLVELDEPTAKRLVKAGAVVEPGSLERAAAERARRQYEAVLAQIPDAVRDQVKAEPTDADLEEDQGAGDPKPERPATVEAKGVWVDYAVARGLDRDEMSRLSKEKVIAAVDQLDAQS